MTNEQQLEALLSAYEDKKHELSIFMDGVANWFSQHPILRSATTPIVHSVKSRLKEPTHLREKIIRKSADDDPIAPETLFARVTDLAGVRVLHLHQEQFRPIHTAILAKVNELGDWVLPEPVKAYTWDPESKDFFDGLNIQTAIKDSFYTSVHYLVKPRADSPLCCEIQVRTLFEEIWGEVDHTMNYPLPSELLACREQLRVLAKVVGAGSRLVDSIFRIMSSSTAERSVLN